MPMRHATLRQLRVFAAVARHAVVLARGRRAAPHAAGGVDAGEAARGAGRAAAVRADRAQDAPHRGGRASCCATPPAYRAAARGAARRSTRCAACAAGVLKLGVGQHREVLRADAARALPREPSRTSRIKLSVDNREDVIEQLAANEIDLAIMGRPPRELDTVGRAVRAAPARHHRRARPPARAAAAHPARARSPARRSSSASPARARAPRWSASSPSAASPSRVGMEMSSNETIKQAVMAGMGIAFLSLHTIGLELRGEAAGRARRRRAAGDAPVACHAAARQAPLARRAPRSASSCSSAAPR